MVVKIQKTLIAGVGVNIPIPKLSKFVKEVIVMEGPASANISPTRSLVVSDLSVLDQQCKKIKTSSTPIAIIKNGTTVTIGRNSKSN